MVLSNGTAAGTDVVVIRVKEWLTAWYGEEVWANEDGTVFRVPVPGATYIDVVIETPEEAGEAPTVIHLYCVAMVDVRFSAKVGYALLKWNSRIIRGSFMIVPGRDKGLVDIVLKQSYPAGEVNREEFERALISLGQVAEDLFPRLLRRFGGKTAGSAYGYPAGDLADGGDSVH